MKKLAVIGAGDLGQQIRHIAGLKPDYKFIGFFDDTRVGELDVLGPIDQVMDQFNEGRFDCLMVGIGYKHLVFRQQIFEKLSELPIETVVHPSALIDPTAQIGKGTLIYSGVVLDMNVTIGANVSLNVGCKVAHDTSVGSHSMLSPGVVLSGFVEVGEKIQLGTGTIVIDNVKIGSGIQTGAGAVVTENLSTPGLYVGVPAKLIREF